MKVFFKLDGKQQEVAQFSYSFNRLIEENGRVSSRVRRGSISITLKSDGALKESVINWLSKADSSKQGEITMLDDSDKAVKIIKFENGFVIDYHEELIGDGTNPMESFTISAEKVTVGSASFDFKWPKA